jgi:DNA repair protein RecO (recombination protein O)
MLQKTTGIVLHYVKYSESSVIAYIYTELHGRQAFMISGINQRKAKPKLNLLQPLYLVNINYYHKASRDLHKVKEIEIAHPYSSIPFDIAKSSVTLFLAEVLYKALREQERNSNLYPYLLYSLQLLDTLQTGAKNFHLVFLLGLTKYLGFFPHNTYSATDPYFDLMNGVFLSSAPIHNHYTTQELSHWFDKLFSLSFNDLNAINLNSTLRYQLLEKLLEYYALHIDGFHGVNSLEILKSIFHN